MWMNFDTFCKKKPKRLFEYQKEGQVIKEVSSGGTQEVKDALKSKKVYCKQWQESELEEDRIQYKSSKKMANRKVEQYQSDAQELFYSKLEQAENYKEIFKLARHPTSIDIRSTSI